MTQFKLLLLLGTFSLGGMPLSAQIQNGSLTGIVSNQAGVGLSQAAVTVQNTETLSRAMTRPEGNGAYRFDNLPPGKYSIRASAKGLTTVQINDILIQANKMATVNVTLSESRIRAVSVVQVSEAPEPTDLAAPAPVAAAPATPLPPAVSANEDAKVMDPKFITGEINAIRDRLALSADQQARIHEIFQQRQVLIAAIRSDNKLTPAERRDAIRAARLEADQKFRALLNENQLDEYGEILRERRERMAERKQEAAAALASH